jgi:hypothetical protein
MKMNKNISKKGMSLSLTFSWFFAFLILLLFSLIFFAGTSYLQKKNSLFAFVGTDKIKIELANSAVCEKELTDALIKMLNSEIVIGEERVKVKTAIENSTLSKKSFQLTAEEIFENAFPKIEKGLIPWGVWIDDLEGMSEELETKGINCYDKRDMLSEIVIGDKKISACLIKSYCEVK